MLLLPLMPVLELLLLPVTTLPDYNGYKLKGSHGGPLIEEDIRNIENLINPETEIDLEQINIETLIEKGTCKISGS